MLKNTLIAVLAAFALSGIAAAQAPAEPKGDSANPPAEQKKDSKARHDHSRDHKQGAPASANAKSEKSKKKPLHDHRKEHKQG